MTTKRREAGGSSWWWAGAGEEGQPGGGEFALGEMSENQVAANGGYQLHEEVEMPANHPEVEVQQPEEELNADFFQLSYPRPRLRWTAELHDEFVKAVDQLGGANKATPKGIKNLMRIQGITLYHLKSHLQKYRLGKMGRKLWRRDFIPANHNQRSRQRGAGVPPMNVNLQAGPTNISNVFGAMNVNGSNALGAEAYGNLHPLVEPQAAVENLELAANFAALYGNHQHVGSSSSSGANMEEQFGGDKPALLPLFPPIPEGSEFNLPGGGRRPIAPPPRPAEMAYVDDYLNSLQGYSSSEFALPQGHEYAYNVGMFFGSFFDEVAGFSKADDTSHLTSVDARGLAAGVAHYYYP